MHTLLDVSIIFFISADARSFGFRPTVQEIGLQLQCRCYFDSSNGNTQLILQIKCEEVPRWCGLTYYIPVQFFFHIRAYKLKNT